MRTTIIIALFLVLTGNVPVANSQEVSQDEVIVAGDNILSTEETTMVGDPTSEGGDVANIINPDGSLEGKVQVKDTGDGFAEVYRSGQMVERDELMEVEDCKVASGMIGRVRICGDATTLSLVGRPDFNCPKGAGNMTEACALIETPL